MWKRERTWSRIRRILELEQQNTVLKETSDRLRIELLVSTNRVRSLNELLQAERQANQGSPDLEWRYNVAREFGSASGAARKGTEEVTEGVTEQTEEGTKGTA